mgnify:CR=1 FL=1
MYHKLYEENFLDQITDGAGIKTLYPSAAWLVMPGDLIGLQAALARQVAHVEAHQHRQPHASHAQREPQVPPQLRRVERFETRAARQAQQCREIARVIDERAARQPPLMAWLVSL